MTTEGARHIYKMGEVKHYVRPEDGTSSKNMVVYSSNFKHAPLVFDGELIQCADSTTTFDNRIFFVVQGKFHMVHP